MHTPSTPRFEGSQKVAQAAITKHVLQHEAEQAKAAKAPTAVDAATASVLDSQAKENQR